MAAPRSCVVCGTAVLVPPAGGAALCLSARCRWTYHATPAHQRCAQCARPLAPPQLAGRVCDDARCRQAQHVQRWRRWSEARRRRRLAFAHALHDRGVAAGVADAAAHPVVIIPRVDRTTGRLPAHRRRAARERLAAVLAEAMHDRARGAPPPPVEPPAPLSPETDALLGRGCAECRGYCCTGGGDHAYLTADAMRRYLDAHPQASAGEVLDDYARRIPARSYVGSCVYHGSRGCTLPREMRADICNRHLCRGLEELRRQLPPGAPPRAFLVAMRGETAPRGVFVDGGGERAVYALMRAAPAPDSARATPPAAGS